MNFITKLATAAAFTCVAVAVIPYIAPAVVIGCIGLGIVCTRALD